MSEAALFYRVLSYEPRHAGAWKSLNEGWILECGFKIEPYDNVMLCDPQGQVLDKAGHIFMLEDPQGQAVGCCALLAMEDGGFELAKMAVHPDYRGQGLSKRLMETVIAHARGLGAARLFLETNSSLAPAISLYERSGFNHLPVKDALYERVDVFMELRLS